jgi:leader peptidase (prepilin peptidase)/N-methyltransferase
MIETIVASPLFPFFVFVAGACIGSFLNVCIYRIPLEVSIVHPGSHCAACGAPIRWYHNLPIFSWIYLRGRAACCGTKIDFRYCLIELLTGLLFLLLWNKYPSTIFLGYAVFAGGLIVSSCIDIDHFIIPDRFTLGGCIVGFALSALLPQLHNETTAWKGFTESVRGAFIGGIVLLLVAKIGSAVLKKEAMGLGDVKFLAAMGAFLGPLATIFILATSSLFGSLFGITFVLQQQKSWGTRMPYGPFLALSALFWLLGGRELTHDYLQSWDQVTTPGDIP